MSAGRLVSPGPRLRPWAAGITAFLLLASAILLASAPAFARIAGEEPPLIVAMSGDTPPYHSVDARGQIRGLDIDVALAVGRELKRKILFKILPASEVASALQEGTVDMAVGTIDRREDEDKFVLSHPYLFQRARLFVHNKTSFVRQLSDLNHLRVGVREGIDIGGYLNLIQPANRVSESSAESGLKNLMNHAIDVFVGDENESQHVIQEQQLQEITTAGEALLVRKRVFALKRDRAGLADQISQALDNLKANYRLQEIQEQWLSGRVAWAANNRSALRIFLAVIAIMAAVLLASVLWNQRLTEAIADRTRQVEHEHEHFQNIFDHASDGIVVIDPETLKAAEANRTLLELLQYDLEDLKNVKLSDLDASSDHGFASHIRRAYDSGENVLFEVRLVNRSREPIDFFIHARVLPYREKKMVVAIARDITHRKKLEAMKDTILQDVAHELKTPMAKLSVSLEILNQKLSEEAKASVSQQLGVCRRATDRLHQTVEGILHLSRLESHAVHIEMEEVLLGEVLQTVVAELTDLGERKGVALKLVLPADPFSIRGDREMLRRLFVNLIQNAIKFTQQGEVNVELQNDSEFVRVAVKDTGIGLEPGDLTKIFGRFFQKTAAVEGSGIGLTIAQKIVAFHNGVIWAESEGIGRGTQMYVLLPQ